MEQVEIEITGMATTARYGTLKSGTVLRTDSDYAAHLVNECGAAKYIGAAPTAGSDPAPVVASVKASSKPAKSKK